MKKIIIISFILIITSSLFAQKINHSMMDPDLNKEILIGKTNETGLVNPIFVEDWQSSYDAYVPDKIVAKKLRKIFKKQKGLNIKVFFGSWCGDSQEQLPNYVKLVHLSKIKATEYYAVDRHKSMPCMDITNYKIDRVPTFIVYKDTTEIGRIIESPEVSIEKDLLKIVQ